MTDERKRLQETIGNLYTTFAPYVLRHPVEGCSCCILPSDQRRLADYPLHELPAENLREYAFSALTTWGDSDDFRHFLPRIFELAAFEPGHLLDLEIVFEKLRYAHWWE